MLNTHFGRPIGRIDNKLTLYIVDPDSDKFKAQINKIKGSKIKKSIKCCRYHGIKCNEYGECCNRCPTFYESSEEDIEDFGMKEYHTNNEIKPLPDFTQRFVEYIAGPSGSGKSTMSVSLAKEYQREFPNKKIFIFSRTKAKDDPAYKDLKYKQFLIDEELLNNPLDITKEVSKDGCLLIFDDCGTIPNEALKKEIERIICDAAEVGRKLQVSMIITNHLVIPTDKKFARTLLNEMTTFSCFPKSGSAQQINYAAKTYFGLSRKQIENILHLNSRYVRINKGYPQFIQYSKGANIL